MNNNQVSHNKISVMVDSIVMDLLTELRPLLGCLYKLTDCVALLDLLLAFAHNCTVSNYGMYVSCGATVTGPAWTSP